MIETKSWKDPLTRAWILESPLSDVNIPKLEKKAGKIKKFFKKIFNINPLKKVAVSIHRISSDLPDEKKEKLLNKAADNLYKQFFPKNKAKQVDLDKVLEVIGITTIKKDNLNKLSTQTVKQACNIMKEIKNPENKHPGNKLQKTPESNFVPRRFKRKIY